MDSRFSDSNDFSNGSSTCCIGNTNTNATATATTDHNRNNFLFPDAATVPDVAALRRLSDNFDSIFDSPDVFADARIGVSGGSGGGKREVAVHRCILSARSAFFRAKFRDREREKEKEKGRGGVVKFELKELARDFDVSFESLVAVLSYLYSGKVRPLPRDVCMCADEECPHLTCRPAVDFLVEVLYLSSTFQIYELVALFQSHMLDILDKVSSDDIVIVLHVANICRSDCSRLLDRCIEIVVHSDLDSITLEKSLPPEISKQIMDLRKSYARSGPEGDTYPDKHVKRIHRALDSDDVELVRMLLKEGHTTLDDAYALHYAVAFCDAKTTTELLDLAIADINHRNHRGYTVLHVSAMRKEPKIIVSLLTKGARPTDQTLDGRKALQISKRLTKAVDWYRSTEQGQASPKDRLCIEILEQAERRDPLLGEAAFSLAIAGEGLRTKLLHLESRVGLARLLFPMEAQVVMDIANVPSTSELPLAKDLSRPQSAVDLNEVPFKLKEESLQRMKALSRTVELGKRYFPRCSQVLDKIVEDDNLNDLATIGNESPEQQVMKKQKYSEFEELVNQAFTKDKEETDLSILSSSSSSTSIMKPQARVALRRNSDSSS
ncbi:BTB/POZ domain and ankyrin repeat-containing protein [Drosera capensis]